MSDHPKYTVLGKGESYREKIPNRKYRPAAAKRSFEQAQERLGPQVTELIRGATAVPTENRLDEIVIEVRLGQDYLAKSHHPEDLLREMGLQLRGSAVWCPPPGPPKKKAQSTATILATEPPRAKALYVSGQPQSLRSFESFLNAPGDRKAAMADVTAIDEIRLPTAEERVPSSLLGGEAGLVAVEIVLFAWDKTRGQKAVDRVKALLKKHGVDGDRLLVRPYMHGPIFIAGKVPRTALRDISHLNFLRVARLLPRVELTRTTIGLPVPAPQPPKLVAMPQHWVAVFDGGVVLPHAHLDGLVVAKDCTSKPAIPEFVEHGTAVCSAVLFDSIVPSQTLEQPVCGVLSFRVLPDARDDDLELYGVVDAVEREVPLLPPSCQVVSLSLGPAGPIDASSAPSRFTYALDRLSYDTGRLFFTAVGNWGAKKGLERIQTPADSVNNIAVGAYRLDPTTGTRLPAEYSCRGPGRAGGGVKPDLIAFGGSPEAPFQVLDSSAGRLVGTQGTSFATPSASAFGATLIASLSAPIDGQTCRALLIHSTEGMTGHGHEAIGWGALPRSVESVLACSKTRVTVLYSGVVSPRNSWLMPFLLPETFAPNSEVQFDWTIVYTPEVDPTAVDDYTLASIEPQFRPHKNRYRFSPPEDEEHAKPVTLDVVTEHAQAEQLEQRGWTRSQLPISDQNVGRRESTLRAQEAKWETVVRGRRKKRSQGILSPCVTIGIMGRGPWDRQAPELQARYAAVLTVSSPNYKLDLYAQVLAEFDKLQPLTLRSRLDVLLSAQAGDPRMR
jgi:hypothetical protein